MFSCYAGRGYVKVMLRKIGSFPKVPIQEGGYEWIPFKQIHKYIRRGRGLYAMLRRVNLVVLLGLIVGTVFAFGLTAGAQTGSDPAGNEVEEAQQRLAELRMDAGAAYEAHGNAVFQLGELDGEIAATTEDLAVTEDDLVEAQGRLEDRASTMYKSGNVGFVDVLVGAENFNEFANRLELWVRLLSQERAEFDRVREIRDTLAEKKSLLEATRDRRVEALDEADAQLDRASTFEQDAQSYLDGLNAELQAAMEAEQARQVEEARAAGERIRAEIAAAEPETVERANAQPVNQRRAAAVQDIPAEAIPAGIVIEAPEKTVRAEPVAATVPETDLETPSVDLEAQQRAERQAARAARLAAEQRAAEQAAAERYAAEKATAAEGARLAAEQAASAEQEQYAAQAAKAERRAELAAQRAAAEQQAAEDAAAEQAAAELLAAEQSQAEQQAAEQQYADEQYEEASPETSGGGTTTEAPADEQYAEGDTGTAALSASAAPAAPASASGSAVVAEGAARMGTPYVFSPPGPCSANVAEDCSCFTMLTYQAFGISLPDDPVAQFGMGAPVSGPPQAGDLVFWAEGGAGITHVGIATGNGTTVHASAYAGYVTETPIDAIPGYVGARRVL